jgi:hypothetical protein
MKNWALVTAVLIILIAVAGVLLVGCSSTAPAVDGLKPVVDGQEDPTGDLFDINGAAVTGESYLDITAVDVRKDGEQYIFLMKLGGDVPAETPEPNNYIGWDFMIDTDKNFETGTTWSLVTNDLGFELIANDIGYEYIVRYSLTNSARKYQIFDTKSGKNSNISGRVIGNVVELTVPASLIGDTQSFSWTAAVRKYISGTASAPLSSDKAPGHGHFSYPAATSSPTPSVYQGILNGNWAQTPLVFKGTLSMTIYSDSSIQGSLEGDATGIMVGQVDSTGKIDCYFISCGLGITPFQRQVGGQLSISGDTISLEGGYSIGGQTVTFSATSY